MEFIYIKYCGLFFESTVFEQLMQFTRTKVLLLVVPVPSAVVVHRIRPAVGHRSLPAVQRSPLRLELVE